jgi:adenosylhomocysteine nucleosidase
MREKIILIQVAMEVEGNKIIEKLESLKKINIQSYTFYEGILQNHKIVVSLSKVGLIHTSASLSLAIEKYHPTMILNIGIAGATDKELHTKDIVVGESIININSYRTPYKKEKEGSSPNEWELLTFLSGETDRFIEQKANSELLSLTKNILNSKNIYYGRIGSGDAWNREIDRINYLNQKYNILCEDMESIATYTIANQNNIPVISIKMISDNILTGEDYDRNISTKLQELILKYLEKLIEKY